MPHSISIHALREESDYRQAVLAHGTIRISIHALREESDQGGKVQAVLTTISIHALREESDKLATDAPLPVVHFNPRSP